MMMLVDLPEQRVLVAGPVEGPREDLHDEEDAEYAQRDGPEGVLAGGRVELVVSVVGTPEGDGDASHDHGHREQTVDDFAADLVGPSGLRLGLPAQRGFGNARAVQNQIEATTDQQEPADADRSEHGPEDVERHSVE